jgi:hypothetical protein
MMKTFSYASVRTRTEAVVDQVDMFLQYAGITEPDRRKILKGVEERWLSHIGVFLVRNEKRFLEAEISVDWDLHSEQVQIKSTVRTDLPGWDGGIAPEVRTVGQRFGRKAQELKSSPSFWVRFTESIRENSTKYQKLCNVVGVGYGLSAPEWEATPDERSYEILDLSEVNVSLRSSERD